MRLRFLATGIAVLLLANGLALGFVGIATFSTSVLAAVGAVAAALALITYAIGIAVRARRGGVPNWIRHLPHSAPL